ncbi:MAG: trypsin-like peptidase domain-containing protein [Pseudonocardiaceae bacterium]
MLDADSTPVGTCFQVTPGVLVTAWHVLNDLEAGDEGATVMVDGLDGGCGSAPAKVLRVDPVHDLAVLRRAEPLPASVLGLSATDVVALRTDVVVTGVSVVDDPGHAYRFLDAVGSWTGGTTWDDQVPVGAAVVDVGGGGHERRAGAARLGRRRGRRGVRPVQQRRRLAAGFGLGGPDRGSGAAAGRSG